MRERASNGVVIFETAWIVAIATGLKRPSANVKTGNMVQIWILNRNVHPVVAQQLGKDKAVCGDCPLRPALGGGCYVETGKAPAAIWRAYRAGRYPRMASTEIFRGRAVRFGAYGDPSKLPLALVADIAAVASKWAGYTHQWRDALKQGYRSYLMASCDDVAGQIEASKMGWRTFRVAPISSDWRMRDEISCPASKESGHRTTCAKCGLCNGAQRAIKNVVIQQH